DRDRKPQPVRPRRRRVDARHQQGDDGRVEDQGRAGLHQHLWRRRRCGAAVRRLQEERLRPREGPRLAGQLPADQERLREIRRTPRVGFIGLGKMGGPMASNLQRKGFPLAVCDLNTAAVRRLEDAGARPAPGCVEIAARSDVVITMLPDSASVEQVLLGTDGVIEHLQPGSLVMDMSTIDPLLTDRLAAAAAARQCAFVDAPVGRLASHAERGESLFMVGSTDDAFVRVKPLLEAMGTTIHHCGPPGAGIRTKLVNNYLAIVSCGFNAEALALSQRFGLSLEKTLEVVHGTTATNG